MTAATPTDIRSMNAVIPIGRGARRSIIKPPMNAEMSPASTLPAIVAVTANTRTRSGCAPPMRRYGTIVIWRSAATTAPTAASVRRIC